MRHRPAAPQFVAPVPDRIEALTFPVAYDGRTYTSITLRRPSSGVLGRWFEQLQDASSDPASVRMIPPIFVDEAGEPIPDEVLNALDDDDQQRLFAETEPFFPKRLADALELLARD